MINNELSEIFKQLCDRLKEFGQTQEVKIKESTFKVYKISEVSLQTEITKNVEKTNGISFEALDDSLFLTADGSVSVSTEDNNEVSVYTLKDDETLRMIYLFLKWRLMTFKKIGF